MSTSRQSRSLTAITRDLAELSSADRQSVVALAYQLKALDYPERITPIEAAHRRLLRDIISGQASDLRLSAAHLENSRAA